MGVSSWMVRSMLIGRGPRGVSGSDKGVKLDLSRDPAENTREILVNITKKHGTVPESHLISYCNTFVKIISDSERKDLGFSTEDILLCLRPSLVHDSSFVRAAALRVVKYLIQTKQDFAICMKLQYPCLLVRSLDLLLDNDCERTQALQVARRLLSLNPAEFPVGLARCLVSIAMTPLDIRDRMIRAVLGTLTELCILNPDVFILSNGVKALVRALRNVGASPRIGESVVGALLFLINKPETRSKAMIDFDCLATPYTDPHTLERTSEVNISTESQLQWAHHILVSVLRSWPGLLHFCHPNKDGLKSIVNTLYLNQREIRKAVLDLLYDLLCLAQPEWSDEISVALDAVDSSRYLDSFKLSEGFVAAEGKMVLPHISKSRVNLIEVHLSLLLYCFLEVGLLDAIVEVIVADDTFLSVRATILLGELLHLIHLLLPPECCHLTPALPNLLSYAVRGRTTVHLNRAKTLPKDKCSLGSYTQLIKKDLIQHNKQKKKSNVGGAAVGGRADRVRTISGQSCRSRTVSDSSGERSRVDRSEAEVNVLPSPIDESDGYDSQIPSKTGSIMRDIKDDCSTEIGERQDITSNCYADLDQLSEDFAESRLINNAERSQSSPPNQVPDWDLPNISDTIGVDPPYSSRAQQRALTAVSALSRLHRLLRKRPAPASIFLDHLITCIDRKKPPNSFDIAKTKGKSTHNKNKLTQVLTKECEEAIKESGVLSVKDPFIWNWDSIRAILKSKATCLYETGQRQFLRKVVHFLLPKSRQLLRIDIGIDRRAANTYTLTAFELIDCLLLSPEDSESEKLLIELFLNISDELSTLLKSNSAHECLFSPQNIMNTLCSDYFFYIGHMTREKAGRKVLDRIGIMQQIYDLVSVTKHTCYIKLIVSVLNYTEDDMARKILGKALSSQNLASRLYCTRLLHVMLRSPLHNRPEMIDWVVELLVNQLYDDDRTVVNAAVAAFDEASDCKEYLEAIVKLRPSLLHLGDNGLLLLIRFLSTDEGFAYLQEAGFVATQLERWATHFNYKYVCLVERQLCDSLTLHQRGEDGRYCTRLSGHKHTPTNVFILPHLYGQLTQHEVGFNTLKEDGNIKKLIKVVISGHCRNDEEILQLKGALWALGHVTGSPAGAKWARDNRITAAMVHTVKYCPVYSVRATAFYALNITATTSEGASSLRSVGWHTVKHHRHEKWPVLASLDILEDILLHDSDTDVSGCNSLDESLVDHIGKSGFYLPKDLSTGGSDEYIHQLPDYSGVMSSSMKSATLPYCSSRSGIAGVSKYCHIRSASESKADSPSVLSEANSSTLTPQLSHCYVTDSGDGVQKSRSDSCTTGSSSAISNSSSISISGDSLSGGGISKHLASERFQTLSPIPSAGSLSTVKSSVAVVESDPKVAVVETATKSKKHLGLSRQSQQHALAALKSLHTSRRPLPAPAPVLSPLSPIELIVFQDLKQISPLVRQRHSINKPLSSEFEAQGTKLSNLLRDDAGAPPTLPYQSSRSNITCTADTPSSDDGDSSLSSPSFMGICLPHKLSDIFRDDFESSRHLKAVDARSMKESFKTVDPNADAGLDNLSSAESETDTGTDTGYGAIGSSAISAQIETPIKRRHDRSSCLLCSTCDRFNNQRTSRWRKVSAGSANRTRTETESSYGGVGAEGESPVMLPWQLRGGLECVNSVDSSSTDVTSIAQRSVSDNIKSRSVVRRDILKLVEQLANPVLYKNCKQALLNLKQMYSDVFQDICVYSDVYHSISSTSHRIQSRRFLQELFLDIPFSELIEESAAILVGGESGEEFDEESIIATISSGDANFTVNNIGSIRDKSDDSDVDDNFANSDISVNSRSDTNDPIQPNLSSLLKSTSGPVANTTNITLTGNNQSSLLEVILEADARSDSSERHPSIGSCNQSVVSNTFIGINSEHENTFISFVMNTSDGHTTQQSMVCKNTDNETHHHYDRSASEELRRNFLSSMSTESEDVKNVSETDVKRYRLSTKVTESNRKSE